MPDPVIERKLTPSDRATVADRTRAPLDTQLRVRSVIFGESGVTLPRWGTQSSLSELSAAKRAELEQNRRDAGNGRAGHQESLTMILDAKLGLLMISFIDGSEDAAQRHITLVPLNHVRQMTLE